MPKIKKKVLRAKDSVTGQWSDVPVVVSEASLEAAERAAISEANAYASAQAIEAYKYDAEAWAVGKRGGEAVPSSDPTYENNAKYYADASRESEQHVADEISEIIATHAQPAVEHWLDNHPEATTTVQDGALTEEKFSEALKLKTIKDYVTPEMFGAIGDGVADDSSAFQNALNVGGLVLLGNNKTYFITQTLSMKAKTTISMNGATIRCTNKHLFYNFVSSDEFVEYLGNGDIIIRDGNIIGGAFGFIHANNVLISNIRFYNSTNDHFIEICACKNFIIDKCIFSGMNTVATSVKEYINIDNCTWSSFPHVPEGSVMLDGTVVDSVLISDCIFDRNETVMEDAVGKHSYYSSSDHTLNRAKNITLKNCRIIGATESAFQFLGVENLTIDHCFNDDCNSAFVIRDCDYVKITNNESRGVSIQSKISNTNHMEILQDFTETKVNERGFLFSGICDDISYLNSVFINNGALPPMSLYASSVITNINCKNNLVCNNSITHNYFSIPGNTINYTLRNIDYIVLATNINSSTLTGNFNITELRHLSISIEGGQNIEISSAANSNFSVGDVYKVMLIGDNDTPYVATVSIDSANTLSLTGSLKLNSVYGRS